ncbi:MAG TPA: Imm31 family immunity protein [Rheinheimera sp.]|uniref:Imm31 family immunity protein n=1 Tax=Arsukibacterium sp. TaxID=1977258 RepID=UPI00299E4FB4|nr:Imm31 family immunity protein [Arsukibacterium sp.]MDX1536078.1 Imm31 family immunity protein [Arsukibacterium sp.]HEX5793866.1 Imm31 family immunity protein [Rheinheimera sp.]
MDPKFKFFEKVIVSSDEPSLKTINGRSGAILGISEDSGHGFSYSAHIYEYGEVWVVMESDLEPTGEFDSREAFYDGYSVQVGVDAKGRGTLG